MKSVQSSFIMNSLQFQKNRYIKKSLNPMYGQSKGERSHITISCEEECDPQPPYQCDDTPTKSEGVVETCGLSILQVKKSINFDLSRENSSDSFIARETVRKDLFFKVESITIHGKNLKITLYTLHYTRPY